MSVRTTILLNIEAADEAALSEIRARLGALRALASRILVIEGADLITKAVQAAQNAAKPQEH